MRIAVVSNAFPPDARGGAGRIAGVYADLLAQHGHEVRVWGPTRAFTTLGAQSVAERFRFHILDLKPNIRMTREILDWKPDVLLTHNLTGCGFSTPRVMKESGLRWVHVLHDVQLFEPSGVIIAGESWTFLRWIWRMIWALLRRSVMRTPDVVVSPTQWLLDQHRSYGFFRGVKSQVIPNPIKIISPRVDSRGDKQVVFVGRLDWDKGLDLLLEALKMIPDVGARLVLVGDGSMRASIDAQHDPSIELRGQKDPDEVLKIMNQSSVVVVPSRVLENQPTVILEAAAADCRIVATDVGGVRETLGDAGWLVPPVDVDTLAQALREALERPRSADEQEKRRELVLRHDPEAALGALLGVLTSNLKT